MECFALAPKLVGKHVTTTGQKGKGCQRPITSILNNYYFQQKQKTMTCLLN